MVAPVLVSMAAVVVSQAERPKLAVLEFSPGAGVESSLTGPLTDVITAEVQVRGFFDVICRVL
jgi:hypothetical protein